MDDYEHMLGHKGCACTQCSLAGSTIDVLFDLDIMRHTVCLAVNPIIVDGYASLFDCTTAVRASDLMTAFS